MSKPKSISVFLLAYNDENTIEGLVRDAVETLKALNLDFEIIVGNDASQDETAKVLKKLQKEIPNLKVIHHETNQGYGGNLKSGLRAAIKDFIFYTDGDGQYDVKELPRLLGALRDEIDVVNGYKERRGDGIIRSFAGALYAKWLKLLLGLTLKDVDCDFRLIRKSFIDKIELESTSGGICPELILKLQQHGAKSTEVPVSHYPRKYGHSQFLTPRRVAKTLLEDILIFQHLRKERSTKNYEKRRD